MKVVLDTNVLLSGIFFSGSPHLVLRTWREGKYTLVVSPEIMDEYRRTAYILAESYPPVDLQSILAIIEENAKSNPAPSLSLPGMRQTRMMINSWHPRYRAAQK